MFRIVHFTLAIVLLGAVTGLVRAEEPAKTGGAALLEQLKALKGDWVDAKGNEKAQGKVLVSYRVTAGGSAVTETLFPGTHMEMLSVYHLDGKDLVMTHYCMLQNQPRFRARPSERSGIIHFDFAGGCNIDPKKDNHVHGGRLEIVGKDRLRSAWWMEAGGKKAEDVSLELVRKK